MCMVHTPLLCISPRVKFYGTMVVKYMLRKGSTQKGCNTLCSTGGSGGMQEGAVACSMQQVTGTKPQGRGGGPGPCMRPPPPRVLKDSAAGSATNKCL